MKGSITQIEDATVQNSKYRQVLFTATHSQLILMSLKPGEEMKGHFTSKIVCVFALHDASYNLLGQADFVSSL